MTSSSRPRARAADPAASPPKKPRRQKGAPPAERSTRSSLALEVDEDVLEFIDAIDRFKKRHSRPFPSWSEVLGVVKALGYKKG